MKNWYSPLFETGIDDAQCLQYGCDSLQRNVQPSKKALDAELHLQFCYARSMCAKFLPVGQQQQQQQQHHQQQQQQQQHKQDTSVSDEGQRLVDVVGDAISINAVATRSTSFGCGNVC